MMQLQDCLIHLERDYYLFCVNWAVWSEKANSAFLEEHLHGSREKYFINLIEKNRQAALETIFISLKDKFSFGVSLALAENNL